MIPPLKGLGEALQVFRPHPAGGKEPGQVDSPARLLRLQSPRLRGVGILRPVRAGQEPLGDGQLEQELLTRYYRTQVPKS